MIEAKQFVVITDSAMLRVAEMAEAFELYHTAIAEGASYVEVFDTTTKKRISAYINPSRQRQEVH